MLKDNLRANLHEIIKLGPRASGSLDELTAAKYLETRLDQFGVTEVAIEPFASASHCVLDAELKDLATAQEFEALPCLFSPGGAVTGELIFIGNCHTSYVENEPDLSGKIGLLNPSGSLQERIDFILELERRGMEALIVASTVLDLINTKVVRFPEIKRLPTISVSWRTACQLKQQAGHQFSINVTSQPEPRYESVNVVGKIPGSSDNWLLISAHIDSIPYGVGANDNAGGCAALLELARQLASEPQPEATIYLLFSGSEENGANDFCGAGAKAFYQKNLPKLANCIAHLEIDDIGNFLSPQEIYVGGNKKFIDLFKTSVSDNQVRVVEKYDPGCDHGSAIKHGIPFAWFTNAMFPRPIYHTPQDSLEFVDIEMIVAAFKIIKQAVKLLSSHQPFLPYLNDEKRLIRPARYADIDDIKTITRLAFEPVSLDRMAQDYFATKLGDQEWHEYKNNSVSAQCEANIYQVIVCEVAGRTVGYATMSLDFKRGIAEIGNNAVHPDFQGMGLGKAMQQEIMRRMLESGFDKFKVSTLTNDVIAQKVYEKLGFEKIMSGIYYLKKIR
ncbi:MAG: GNAT family N-acetyltransferase [Victivallaceae bacterium]|nr:GNAT family N-acetyltransferase [Victivallaceae bacterium]